MTSHSSRLLTLPEVATRLRRRSSWFYRNRKRLEDEEGFPPPVRGLRSVWDAAAIDAWLDGQLAGRSDGTAPPARPVSDEEALLHQRAIVIAAGRRR